MCESVNSNELIKYDDRRNKSKTTTRRRNSLLLYLEHLLLSSFPLALFLCVFKRNASRLKIILWPSIFCSHMQTWNTVVSLRNLKIRKLQNEWLNMIIETNLIYTPCKSETKLLKCICLIAAIARGGKFTAKTSSNPWRSHSSWQQRNRVNIRRWFY